MGRVYADPAAYMDYTGSPGPSDIAARLARASTYLDGHVLLAAVYDVDTAGMPTDPRVAEALSDATCAQVSYWLDTGNETGAAAAYQSVSIGEVNLSRAGGKAGDPQASRTAPAVLDVLNAAEGIRLIGPWEC